jgi:hypothetical protein
MYANRRISAYNNNNLVVLIHFIYVYLYANLGAWKPINNSNNNNSVLVYLCANLRSWKPKNKRRKIIIQLNSKITHSVAHFLVLI